MTRTSRIIAGGFLVRAFLGQALFWISYLHLPFARSLQVGNGFWFFAIDGADYLWMGEAVASGGLESILFLDPHLPSRFFLRLVALFVAVFGEVASVAILINCASYVLASLALARMGKDDVVMAAIAFGPAAVLFASQLLKDTFFALLIVLMFAALRWWQELWRSGGTAARFLACAAALTALIYALAGIRWYFAMIVWGSSAIFLALVTWGARRRRLAVVANVLLFVVLSQAVRVGAPDMPPLIARVLAPATALRWRPTAATTVVRSARRGFDRTPGSTTIESGRLLQSSESAPPPATATAPSARVPQTFASRLITGFSATFLPRFIAQPLGLVQVGGGRGFWWFADVDTIVLDLVLLYAALTCARALRSRGARATPLFVQTILVFVCTAGPMIYTVNNFGTLFRLRQMLFVVAAIAPLTLRHSAAGPGTREPGSAGDQQRPSAGRARFA